MGYAPRTLLEELVRPKVADLFLPILTGPTLRFQCLTESDSVQRTLLARGSRPAQPPRPVPMGGCRARDLVKTRRGQATQPRINSAPYLLNCPTWDNGGGYNGTSGKDGVLRDTATTGKTA